MPRCRRPAPVKVDNGASLLPAGPRLARLVLAALAVAGGLSVSLAAEPLGALERARAERRAGDLDTAANLLSDALAGLGSEAPPTSRSLLHRELGSIRIAQHRPEDAARQFESALQAVPDQGVVHYQSGLAYRMAGRERLAASHLRKAVETGFSTTAGLLHLARADFAIGNYSGGLDACRRLVGMQLRSAAPLLRTGRLLFDRFFYRDALQAFDKALAIDADSYEARHFAALTNHLLNRHAEAADLLAGLDAGRQTAESSSLLASALGQQGFAEEAEAEFHAAIERWPSSPHPRLNLAFLLLDLGRPAEAEARLDELRSMASAASPKVLYAVQRDSCPSTAAGLGGHQVRPEPSRAAAYLGLAADLANRQHHRTAVEVLGLARSHGADSPGLLTSLADSCLHIDPSSPHPATLLRQALESDPDLARAHHLLGRALLRRDRRAEAIRSHQTAVRLAPLNSSYHLELGRALAAGSDSSDRARAVQALVEAAELEPRNVLARYELGKLLAAMGRYAEAIASLEAAVAAEPEFHNAYYQLGQACLRAGRRAEAERHLKLFGIKRAAAEARAEPAAGFADGG